MPSRTSLREIIDTPVAGYWGLSDRGASSTVACRVVRNGDVAKDGYIAETDLSVRWFTADELAKAQVEASDSILVSSGAYTGNVGRVVGPSNGLPVIVSNFARRIRPLGSAHDRWLFHLLRSVAIQRQVWPHTGGSAIPNLGSSFYGGCEISFLPPLPEQRLIADILDTLHEAICKTEAIVTKLKQVKQGLIHDLLTRGIDDNGELRDPERHPEQFKDSPLGRIPRGWETLTGEECFALHGGTTPAVIREDSEGEHLYLKVDDFNLPENKFALHASQVTFDDLRANQQAVRRVFPPGVVAFPKRGAAIFKNRARVLRRSGTIDPNLMVANPTRLRPEVLAAYLVFFDLSNICDNSGLPQINNKHLYPLTFPVPPNEEQGEIAQRIEVLENRQRHERSEIRKLVTVQQGLMKDLLTGRVRVTNLLDEAAQ